MTVCLFSVRPPPQDASPLAAAAPHKIRGKPPPRLATCTWAPSRWPFRPPASPRQVWACLSRCIHRLRSPAASPCSHDVRRDAAHEPHLCNAIVACYAGRELSLHAWSLIASMRRSSYNLAKDEFTFSSLLQPLRRPDDEQGAHWSG
jgi:hypothetical protein